MSKTQAQREYDKRVTAFLGASHHTARNRLNRKILYHLAGNLGLLDCWQCGKFIETVEEFSVEHKSPYLWVDVDLYWDMDNIAFSHYACNAKKIRNGKPPKHNYSRYANSGCRCDICVKDMSRYNKLKQTKPVPQGVTHGYSSYTNYGCRCVICSTAAKEYRVSRI